VSLPALTIVQRLEASIRDLPDQFDIDAHTSHHFCDGMYVRQLDVPAGVTIVGKTHASRNLFLLVKGSMWLATDDGPALIEAPFMVTTEPGTKRAGYAETDCICMNFHSNPDDERDLVVLESRYIRPEALPAPDKESVEWHG
jgi:hypothetical protein